MRNDYPDHPAGPIPDPDPSEVLEVRQPAMNGWIVVCIGLFMLFSTYPMLGASAKIREVTAAETQTSKAVPILVCIGLACVAFGAWMLQGGRAVVRVRPDGVEFPADGLPPLRWDEVAAIDIGTLNLIGAGGRQDYLGIKIRDGLAPPGASPYSTPTQLAARTIAGWPFDICLPQSSLGLCPAHLSMHLRARLEAFQASGTLPPPPAGLAPLPEGGLAGRFRQGLTEGPVARKRKGCAVAMGLFGAMGAFTGYQAMTGAIDVPPDLIDTFTNNGLFGVGMMAVAFIFVWPHPPDEDE